MSAKAVNRITRSASKQTKDKLNVDKEPKLQRSKRYQSKKCTSSSSESDEYCEPIIKNAIKTQRTPTKTRTNLTREIYELSPVTPPKLQKTSNNIPNTPSSLLQNLSLTSPVKKTTINSKKSLFAASESNRNKVKIENSIKSKKKSVIKTSEEAVDHEHKNEVLNNVHKVPKFHNDQSSSLSQYQNARKALHSTFPTDMPGRESEINDLQEFIMGHLENDTSGSIYVSGPPGTGKTASLNLILQQKYVASQVQHVYINCTAIKSATAVYSRLTKELQLKVTGRAEKDHLSAIERHLKKKHKFILIVLDEIDQLETKNHSILYTIFEWPSRPHSRLILVGIANALDLTDRTLPRLQARCELKPKLLHFAPYTKEQIVKIFTSRLEQAGVLAVFSPVALQMLAGKVAAVSGDVRRALDIGRRVVELADRNKQEDILKSVENFTEDLVKKEAKALDDDRNLTNNASRDLPPTKLKTVNLQEVVSVLNNVYGTSQNLTDDAEETFPLQQKIVVCSLLLMLKKAKNKDITVGKLHEVYSKVCMKRNLTAVDQAEFVGLCSLIETKGIIKVTGKKEPRMNKVSLEWNENEVAEALKDKQLMSMILQDESCLGKI